MIEHVPNTYRYHMPIIGETTSMVTALCPVCNSGIGDEYRENIEDFFDDYVDHLYDFHREVYAEHEAEEEKNYEINRAYYKQQRLLSVTCEHCNKKHDDINLATVIFQQMDKENKYYERVKKRLCIGCLKIVPRSRETT